MTIGLTYEPTLSANVSATKCGTDGCMNTRQSLTHLPDQTRRQAMSHRTCSVGGCEFRAHARGWCQAHYVRWKTTGSVGTAELRTRRPRRGTCSVPECDRPDDGALGLCRPHYGRQWSGRPLGIGPVPPPARGQCSVDGCTDPHSSRGYCVSHYGRFRRHGDPLHVVRYGVRDEAPNWRGDQAGYGAIHDRLRIERGRASEHSCDECGRQALDWTYDYGDSDERVDQQEGHVYSLSPEHYRPMCRACHIRQDRNLARGRR